MKVFKIIDKVRYEIDRAKRVYPTLLRAGVSEVFDFGVQAALDLVDDLKHRISHYRGTCDHLGSHEAGATLKRVRRATPKRAKAGSKNRSKRSAH